MKFGVNRLPFSMFPAAMESEVTTVESVEQPAAPEPVRCSAVIASSLKLSRFCGMPTIDEIHALHRYI